MSTQGATYFGWYNLIVNGLLPFSYVEKDLVRRNSKHSATFLYTFMQYLPALTKRVECKISSLPPTTFALGSDGWSAGITHYVAAIAYFPAQCDAG